jgi:hypothetical protein
VAELFGHEPRPFTGAHAERDRYFFEASGATLFLDEGWRAIAAFSWPRHGGELGHAVASARAWG